MKVEIDNLLYDQALPNCFMTLNYAQGQCFAFVQALDIGFAEARLEKPKPVRYWGVMDCAHAKESLQQILTTGGKWPTLPK